MSKKSSKERDGHPRRERRDAQDPTGDATPLAGDAERAAGDAAVPTAGEAAERFATAAELSERLAALEADLAEAHREAADARQREERLLRNLAERENQLRRLERHREREAEHFRGELVISLLAVLDDFERALESGPDPEEDSFAEGVALVAEGLRGALTQLGLEPIVALGEAFDPALHEAVMQLPNTDAPKGQVIQEMQKGYRLGDRVLRPSRVAVAG
ncbi:MAG: nucleotide exchange factor GrpE [Candidatus Krumholzibacteriota bacterium]|nr:nucleotide exchange factor GrpE [Candidatus Krumholzibacteriota bacterium]